MGPPVDDDPSSTHLILEGQDLDLKKGEWELFLLKMHLLSVNEKKF